MIFDDLALAKALDPIPANWEDSPGFRSAAVLALILELEGQDHLLFTRRREDLPDHPGQIAFPGGMREGEESPLSCALRETQEEVGADPGRVQVLGALPSLTSNAGFRVHAFAGRLQQPFTELVSEPAEVADLLTASLADLANTSHWQLMDVPGGRGKRYPAFQLQTGRLWGLTGALARTLVARGSGEHPR